MWLAVLVAVGSDEGPCNPSEAGECLEEDDLIALLQHSFHKAPVELRPAPPTVASALHVATASEPLPAATSTLHAKPAAASTDLVAALDAGASFGRDPQRQLHASALLAGWMLSLGGLVVLVLGCSAGGSGDRGSSKTPKTRLSGAAMLDATQQAEDSLRSGGETGGRGVKLEDEDRALAAAEFFEHCWAAEVHSRGAEGSLPRALASFLGWPSIYLQFDVIVVVSTASSLMTIWFMELVLDYQEQLCLQASLSGAPDSRWVLALAAAAALVPLLLQRSADVAQRWQDCRASSALLKAVVLALSRKSRRIAEGSAACELEGLLRELQQTIPDLLRSTLQLFAAPLHGAVLIGILAWRLGPPAGLALVALVPLALSAWIAQRLLAAAHVRHQVAAEHTSRLLRSVEQALVVVKCEGWQGHVFKRLASAHRAQASQAWCMHWVAQMLACIGMAWPRLAAATLLAACGAVGGAHPNTALVCLVVLNYLCGCVSVTLEALGKVCSSLPVLQRTEAFLRLTDAPERPLQELASGLALHVKGSFWRRRPLGLPSEERPLLRGVDVAIREGSMTAVLGTPGSGKSALLLAALGELRPGPASTAACRGAGTAAVAYLPPLPLLAPSRVSRSAGALRKEILAGALFEPKRYDAALSVAGLASCSFGGPLQDISDDELAARAALARLAYGQGRVILLDEPSVAARRPQFAATWGEVVHAELFKGCTVLAVVTSLEAAPLLCFDRLIVLQDGVVVKQGAPEDVMKSSEFMALRDSFSEQQDCSEAVVPIGSAAADATFQGGAAAGAKALQSFIIAVGVRRCVLCVALAVCFQGALLSMVSMMLQSSGGGHHQGWPSSSCLVALGLGSLGFGALASGASASACAIFMQCARDGLARVLLWSPVDAVATTVSAKVARCDGAEPCISDSSALQQELNLGSQLSSMLNLLVGLLCALAWAHVATRPALACISVPICIIAGLCARAFCRASQHLGGPTTAFLQQCLELPGGGVAAAEALAAAQGTAASQRQLLLWQLAAALALVHGAVLSVGLAEPQSMDSCTFGMLLFLCFYMNQAAETSARPLQAAAAANIAAAPAAAASAEATGSDATASPRVLERLSEPVVGCQGLAVATRDLCVGPAGAAHSVEDLDLDVAPGEHVAVAGVGATALFLALSGASRARSGFATLGDAPVAGMDVNALRASVAFVAQEPTLLQGPLRESLDPLQEFTQDEMAVVLTAVGLSRLLKDGVEVALAADWSGRLGPSEQRRLALARALLRRPRLLLLARGAAEVAIRELALALCLEATVLVATESLEDSAGCDRIIPLRRQAAAAAA